MTTAWSLYDQVRTYRLDHALRSYLMQNSDAAGLERRLAGEMPCAAITSHERLIVAALAHAALARATQGQAHIDHLRAAASCVETAVRERPGSAAAIVVRASILAERGPAYRTVAIMDLRRSYVAAPYLRHQALWRMRYGASHWDALPDDTRQALLREAEWFARIGPADRAQALAALGDGAAGARLAVRLAYDAPPGPR